MQFRKAEIADVEEIHALVNRYAEAGLMLPKARSAVYENLRDYLLAVGDNGIVGVAALHILWADLGEVRSLAVAREESGRGVGRELLRLLAEEARALGLSRLFALTYQKEFFLKCGYREVSNRMLPRKVWSECINCPKFPDCDEDAVILEL